MKVSEIMTSNVATVGPEDNVVHAAKVMREHHTGDVVVVEPHLSGRIPRGIITDRDLAVGVLAQGVSDPSSILVKDIMARELFTANADDDVFDVVSHMQGQGIRRMPVINRLDVLVGIVTMDDVIRALASRLLSLAQVPPIQIVGERMRRT